MQQIKAVALQQEDYEALKQLALDIKAVFEIGKEIWRLRNELNLAIAQENYARAIELRNRIRELEQRRDAFDALYETSRYEEMIVMQRPLTAEIQQAQQQWELEQQDLLERQRRQRELEEQERRRILEEEMARLQLQQQQDQMWRDQQQKEVVVEKERPAPRAKKVQKKLNVKEEEKVDLSDPFKYNQGDLDLQQYFKPLLGGMGGKLGELAPDDLRRLDNEGLLRVFGVQLWTAMYSENWRLREAAAQAVLNFIELPLPSRYANKKTKKLFLACIEMSRIACGDKILQIYFIGLKILQTCLAPPVCGIDVSPKLINQTLKDFIPLLIDKISELNLRARDISLHTLISLFKHPASKLNILIQACLKACKKDPFFESLYVPVDKQNWRVVLSRLEILLQVLQEFPYTPESYDWKEVLDYAIIPSLFHGNVDVRFVAIEYIIQIFSLIGQKVKRSLNEVEGLKPQLKEAINQRIEDAEKKLMETNPELLKDDDPPQKDLKKSNKSQVKSSQYQGDKKRSISRNSRNASGKSSRLNTENDEEQQNNSFSRGRKQSQSRQNAQQSNSQGQKQKAQNQQQKKQQQTDDEDEQKQYKQQQQKQQQQNQSQINKSKVQEQSPTSPSKKGFFDYFKKGSKSNSPENSLEKSKSKDRNQSQDKQISSKENSVDKKSQKVQNKSILKQQQKITEQQEEEYENTSNYNQSQASKQKQQQSRQQTRDQNKRNIQQQQEQEEPQSNRSNAKSRDAQSRGGGTSQEKKKVQNASQMSQQSNVKSYIKQNMYKGDELVKMMDSRDEDEQNNQKQVLQSNSKINNSQLSNYSRQKSSGGKKKNENNKRDYQQEDMYQQSKYQSEQLELLQKQQIQKQQQLIQQQQQQIQEQSQAYDQSQQLQSQNLMEGGMHLDAKGEADDKGKKKKKKFFFF